MRRFSSFHYLLIIILTSCLYSFSLSSLAQELNPGFQSIYESFDTSEHPGYDLARASLVLVQEASPELDTESPLQRLQTMVEELRQRLRGDQSAVAKLEAMGRYLFKEKGFHYGGESEQNIHFETTLFEREGNCFRLTMLYLILGWELELPMRMVFIYDPDHTLIHYDDGAYECFVETTLKGYIIHSLEGLSIFYEKMPYDILEPKQTLPKLLSQMGTSFYNQKRLDESVQAFRRSMHYDSEFPVVLNYLGMILHFQGESEEGIELLQRAIDKTPNYSRAHYHLGNIYLALEDYEKAQSCFQKSIKLKPDFANALCNMGIIHEKKDDLQKAKQSYLKALELNPTMNEPLYNLALINAKLKNYAEALKYARKAIEQGIKFPEDFLVIIEQQSALDS